MHLNDLLTPWLLLAAAIIPLVYVERWIHSHLYGVGWLLTNDKKSATALYYVILFPGVFVHEFTQWLVAGALNVKTRRVTSWPEGQDNGTLRLDFVQIQQAGRLKAAIIGASPLVVGMSLVWLISNQILDFGDFVTALGTGDVQIIGPALRELAGKTDFFIWLYLMFTISNAMLPTPADRQGWPLVIGAFALVLFFLVVLGSGEVLLETFTGPVATGVRRLSTAFVTVLLVEIPGILLIGFLEEVLERLTRRKFDYSQPVRAARVREPGSNLPLRPGTPLPSVYNLLLPVPDPSELNALRAQARRFSAAASTERPALGPSPAKESPVASPAPALTAPERDDRMPARRGPSPEERPAAGARPLAVPAGREPGGLPAPLRAEAGTRSEIPGRDEPLRERPLPTERRPLEDRGDSPPPGDRQPPFRRAAPQPAPLRSPSAGDRDEDATAPPRRTLPQPAPFRSPSAGDRDEDRTSPPRRTLPQPAPFRSRPEAGHEVPDEDDLEETDAPRTLGMRSPISGAPRPFERPLARPSPFDDDADDDFDEMGDEVDDEDEDGIEELEYIDFDDL